MIDERDAEIVEADIQLSAPLSLGWFGMVGSVKALRLIARQKPLSDGQWVASDQLFEIQGRRVFKAFHVRTRQNSWGFSDGLSDSNTSTARAFSE